jgi:ketosteroid isomerase-like protein
MLPSNVSEFETTKPPPSKGGGPRFSGGLLLTLVLLVALIGVVAFAVTRLPVGTPARPTPVAAQATTAPGAPSSAAPGPASKPSTDTAPPATAPTALPTVVGSPADAATSQAIQDVIRKLDDAQAQAIATNNQQLMAPTATPEFYAEEVANNQDLVDSGVTEVQLLNLEWDQIIVASDGNTANATAYETWSTTFDDGSTIQSRDRNVYTLVKDANGNWRIRADDHPDQQQPGQ